MAKQHRGNGATSGSRKVRITGPASVLEIERQASSDALPSETVVKLSLILPANLQRMLAADDRKIVCEHFDKVLAAVVGAPTPLAVAIGEVEVHQILIAIGDIGNTDLVLPPDAALHRGLRRIVVFLPIVPAAVEMIKDRWADTVIPTGAEHIGV